MTDLRRWKDQFATPDARSNPPHHRNNQEYHGSNDQHPRQFQIAAPPPTDKAPEPVPAISLRVITSTKKTSYT